MTVEEIREELGRLDLSQSALARETGVSRQEVSRWFLGRRAPSARNRQRMVAALERLGAYVEEAAAQERFRSLRG